MLPVTTLTFCNLHRVCIAGFSVFALSFAPLCTLPAAAGGGPATSASQTASDDDSRLDQYALAAPPSAERSVASLATYLSQGAKTEREKARVIFRWMAEKISFDEDSIADEQTPPEPAVVLTRRMAECGGYSQLFESLATAMGLGAKTIWGVMKDFDNPSKVIDYSSHSWNAVKIDGQWQLLDVTWAASHILSNGQVTVLHPFDPSWFCGSPDQFLPSHFPNDASWQLTSAPITRAQFEKLPCLTAAAFREGIKPINYPEGVITAAATLKLTLTVPFGTHLLAQLRQNGQCLGDQYVFAQRDQGQYDVSVAFPHSGDYDLRVFAQHGSSEADCFSVLDYVIKASAGSETDAFPFTWNVFRVCDAEVQEPSTGALTAGVQQNFRLAVPGASAVWVQTGGQKYKLDHQGDGFVGIVKLAAGDVTVYSSFPDKPTTLCGLLRYSAH